MLLVVPKILIVDEMFPSILPLLKEKGFEVEYSPSINREGILDKIDAFQGIVIRSKTVLDQVLLSKATNLRFIARAGAGLDQIDLEEVKKRGIQLFNAPEGNRDAVAEHAVGMLLCLFNHLHLADQQVRSGKWDREGNRGLEIKGKTVGLIGYGNTGQAFAKRLSSFECQVLAYDKYAPAKSGSYATESTMEELFERADILSLHVPLTSETRLIVNETFLKRFKKDIFIINTARGEVIQLKALYQALQSGKVRGACLDVLENEKIGKLTPEQQETFDLLTQSTKVLFSPHVAGWTHESYHRINEVLVEKIATLDLNKP